MKIRDIILEARMMVPNVFPDGDLVVSDHFITDRKDRNISVQYLINMAGRAAKRYKKELVGLHDEAFVLENPDNIRAAFIKKESVKQPGRYMYWMATAREDLRIGAGEPVFKIR